MGHVRARGDFLMDIRKLCIGAAVAAAALPYGAADAHYFSSSDTGVDALDYIEDRHREERENFLYDDETRLIKDTEDMRKKLRHPELLKDPTSQVPTSFEGDDMSWDQSTGDFTAKGHVRITTLDKRRFEADEATGNTIEQRVEVPGRTHLLQMTDGMTRVRLDGYKANYSCSTKKGSIDDASGKAGHYYVTGKRFEFYPDHVVVYDGTATKCAAKRPDYQMRAKKIEVYPDQKIIMTDVEFWLGKAMMMKRHHYENDIGASTKDRELIYPRVGWDDDDGVWIRQSLRYNIAKNVKLTPVYLYGTKIHTKSSAILQWQSGGSRLHVDYGFYDDSDDHWIKKKPSLIWEYGAHFGVMPLSWRLKTEYGQWDDGDIDSTHTYGGVNVYHDPIILGKDWRLFLGVGYEVTHESYDHSRVKGFSYDISTVKEFSPVFAMYTGYHFTKNSENRTLFNYDVDDFERKLETGCSLRLTHLDRIVAGTEYDLDRDSLRDVDYYWYHDVHCAQFVVRYRAKRDSWHVSFNFIPW